MWQFLMLKELKNYSGEVALRISFRQARPQRTVWKNNELKRRVRQMAAWTTRTKSVIQYGHVQVFLFA